MNQVHKETLSHVENALPNRQGLDVEIFGVEGMPEDIRKQHEERIIKNFFDAQKERFEATGNPPPGEARPQKKIKVETPDELKKRFADFRAKKAAAKAAGIPFTGVQAPALPPNVQSPAQTGNPATFVSCFPSSTCYAAMLTIPQQPPFNLPPGQSGYPNFPPAGAPPPAAYNPYPAASALPARPPSLPNAPSLPQRPGFPYPGQAPPGYAGGEPPRQGDDIDELIRMAEAGIKPANTPTTAAPPEAGEKKSKKDKGRMVYADADISPEEKMALLPRYQWSA